MQIADVGDAVKSSDLTKQGKIEYLGIEIPFGYVGVFLKKGLYKVIRSDNVSCLSKHQVRSRTCPAKLHERRRIIRTGSQLLIICWKNVDGGSVCRRLGFAIHLPKPEMLEDFSDHLLVLYGRYLGHPLLSHPLINVYSDIHLP